MIVFGVRVSQHFMLVSVDRIRKIEVKFNTQQKEASISTIFHTQCRVQTLDIYTFLEKDISRDVIYHRIFLKSIFFLVGLRKTIADFILLYQPRPPLVVELVEKYEMIS